MKRGNQDIGHYTGLYLANQYGFTTQNSSCYEVCSNTATTKYRKMIVDGVEIIVHKPFAEIKSENVKVLRFLDLILYIDKYCELDFKFARNKVKQILKNENISIEMLNKYLPMYPVKIYKNFFKFCVGSVNELV